MVNNDTLEFGMDFTFSFLTAFIYSKYKQDCRSALLVHLKKHEMRVFKTA